MKIPLPLNKYLDDSAERDPKFLTISKSSQGTLKKWTRPSFLSDVFLASSDSMLLALDWIPCD